MANIIHDSFEAGQSLKIGHHCVIDRDVRVGQNVTIGHFAVIEPDVVIGDNVSIGHRATLKSGTRIGDDSTFDDHCITTGACLLGRKVNIRTGAIISRSTIIEDFCFVGPGVITNHTKHVTHGRTDTVTDEQLLTTIGYGSIIGSQASLLAGIHIGPQSIVGGGSVVIKDLAGHAVYVGSPSHRLSDLPPGYQMDQPANAGSIYLTTEVLDLFVKYMPKLRLPAAAEALQSR
jgi:acetyltransferase-like isoleucine patch superfamily enzyme